MKPVALELAPYAWVPSTARGRIQLALDVERLEPASHHGSLRAKR